MSDDMKKEVTILQQAVAETAEEATKGTLEDLEPPGALVFQGKAVRPFAWIDYKLLSLLTDIEGVKDEDAMLAVCYCQTLITDEEIADMWNTANSKPKELITKATTWTARIDMKELGEFMASVGKRVESFTDMNASDGEVGAEGNE